MIHQSANILENIHGDIVFCLYGKEKNSTYSLSLSVPTVELLSFGLSLHHWINGLQVGGVCHERQCHVLVTDPVHPPVIHPQVIFHIARTLRAQSQMLNLSSLFIFINNICAHVLFNRRPTQF